MELHNCILRPKYLNANKYKTSKTIYDEMNENEIPPDVWNTLLLSKTLWRKEKLKMSSNVPLSWGHGSVRHFRPRTFVGDLLFFFRIKFYGYEEIPRILQYLKNISKKIFQVGTRTIITYHEVLPGSNMSGEKISLARIRFFLYR